MAEGEVLTIAMPKDAHLLAVCQTLIGSPSPWQRKKELTAIGNLSPRTMSRLFRSEPGMIFSEWA